MMREDPRRGGGLLTREARGAAAFSRGKKRPPEATKAARLDFFCSLYFFLYSLVLPVGVLSLSLSLSCVSCFAAGKVVAGLPACEGEKESNT